MPLLADYVLDAALAKLDTEADRVYLCSQEPTTYAEATSTYALANKTGVSVGAPAAATPDGRKVTIAQITGGSVTATGTATHWALVDSVNSRLLAAGPLSASQAVTSGNSWSTSAGWDVRIPAAA
jgi:hypothetical protein